MAVKTHALFYMRDDGEGANICVRTVRRARLVYSALHFLDRSSRRHKVFLAVEREVQTECHIVFSIFLLYTIIFAYICGMCFNIPRL